MIIEVNTDELASAVTAASRATQALTNAAELLNSIVVHNNWCCDERYAINNNTVNNKRSIQQLQSNANSMYNAIQFSSARFNELQHEIGISFDTVEGPLGAFLSLIPNGSAMPGSSIFSDSSIGNLGNLIRNSAICGFGSIASSFRGK